MILKNTKRNILINAGHHDNDPGKIIINDGKHEREADHVKRIRDEVVSLLRNDTRFTLHVIPDTLTLSQSIAYVNSKFKNLNDGLAIDIHLNASRHLSARGSEAFHGSSKTSQNIAATLSESVSSALGLPNRGAKPDTDAAVGSLGWIRQTNTWASLIEVCFMTNAEDWLVLTRPGGHALAAKGIVNGILTAYGEEMLRDEEEAEVVVPPLKQLSLLTYIIMILDYILKHFGRKHTTLANATAIKEKHEDDIIRKKNVVGVGVGPRNGTGETSIIVLVTAKEENTALDAEDTIPTRIEGVRTDVIEVGRLEPMADNTDRKRPVCGGISAVWDKGTACTLGCVVIKNGKKYALQNTHCANPHWAGAKLGDPIIQPSPNDGGRKGKRDIIGYSSEYLALVLDSTHPNPFDSALVELTVDGTELELDGIGTISPTPADVAPGDAVIKSGRTTGVQNTTVLAIGVTTYVNFGAKYGVGKFTNQILAENKDGYFTSGGDSSSLVINSRRQPIGQIFAGSQSVAIISPIKPIMQHFGFTFDGKPVSDGRVPLEGYVALSKATKSIPYVELYPTSAQPGNKGELAFNMSLRDQPGIRGTRLDTIPAGTKFEIVEVAGDSDGYNWAKVKFD